MAVTLEINGRAETLDLPPETSLLSALRDDLGLTGARFGCGQGMCGACVVLVNGAPVPACTLAVGDVGPRPVTTIEGLAQGGTLHPVQRAFVAEGALQCGYCTSGMILAATALLARVPRPTEEQIRAALAPHLCRCGVYVRAIRAVRAASQ